MGPLFRQLVDDSATLVRQELGLLRAELRHGVARALRGAGHLAAGIGLLTVALIVGMALLVIVLGRLYGEQYWFAALLVGLVLGFPGAVAAYYSFKQLRRDPFAPRKTIESLRETGAWVRTEGQQLTRSMNGQAIVPGDAVRRSTSTTPNTDTDRPMTSQRETEEQKEHQGLLKRVAHEFSADDVSGQAAKVAYYAFLSLPPALLVLFSLTGFFGGASTADWLTRQLESLLPGSASELIQEFVQQIVHDNAPGPFSIGLLLALWAASNVFIALMDALNKAYDLEDDRSFVKRRLLALGVMLISVLLFLGGSALLLAGPEIASALGGGSAGTVWTVLQWPAAFVLVIGAFWVVYYVLPNRDQAGDKTRILKGAAIAAVLWLIATLAFRFYITNFGSYSETYGFLGAVIVLLLWLYLTALVILLGGEINSEMADSR